VEERGVKIPKGEAKGVYWREWKAEPLKLNNNLTESSKKRGHFVSRRILIWAKVSGGNFQGKPKTWKQKLTVLEGKWMSK